MLPKSLDGLKLSFRYKNHKLNITYEITDEAGAEAAIVNGKEIPRNTNLRKYRRSGVLIPDGILKDKNEIILKM